QLPQKLRICINLITECSKAPRGWGWLTNPRKAAYNRAYYRKNKLWNGLLGWVTIGFIVAVLLGAFH
ncbi:hypothetical protein, partial [Komagataeibacter swingsii]